MSSSISNGLSNSLKLSKLNINSNTDSVTIGNKNLTELLNYLMKSIFFTKTAFSL